MILVPKLPLGLGISRQLWNLRFNGRTTLKEKHLVLEKF